MLFKRVRQRMYTYNYYDLMCPIYLHAINNDLDCTETGDVKHQT